MKTEEFEAGMPAMVQYIEERSKNLIRYSDKLSSALIAVDDYFERMGPKTGILLTDAEPFFSKIDEYLGEKVSYRLAVRKNWGLYAMPDNEYMDSIRVYEATRAMKKEAIKRFPVFFQKYADAVATFEAEYKEIAEKAEAIAAIFEER